MSPVARSSNHAGRALLVGSVAVVIVFAVLGLAALAFSGNGDSARLGDLTFQGGDAERLAKEIADRGPIIYSDVSGTGQSRPIILQHLGDDPATGWHAFLAYPPTKGPQCAWRWVPDDEVFVASCDESLTAPADGAGLEQFPVQVVDGKLDIDLNAAARTTTTASTAPESGEVPAGD